MAREESRAIFFMKVKATSSALKLIEELKAQHGVKSYYSTSLVDVVMEVHQCVILEMSIWLALAM